MQDAKRSYSSPELYRLPAALFRAWRVLATGIAFATFMCGGFFLTVAVFPIIRLWPAPPEAKGRRIRRVIQMSFVCFLRYMTLLRIMRAPRIEGLKAALASGPAVIVANHPTLLDVVLLVSLVPDGNCVVKRALWEHFYLGGVVRGADYIPNDNGPDLLERCKRSFRDGRPLLIFPEGTRSPENGLRQMNRGAAQIALRAGAPVLPVVIGCDPPTLMKGQRWFDVPVEPFQLSARFYPAFDGSSVLPENLEMPRQVRALTREFEAFFRRETPGLMAASPGLAAG